MSYGILRRQHVDELHRFEFFAARDRSPNAAVIAVFSGLKRQEDSAQSPGPASR
jgi:hypothetical protein